VHGKVWYSKLPAGERATVSSLLLETCDNNERILRCCQDNFRTIP